MPPLCFFPKGQRNKLITVPACDLHNNEQSEGDELIRNLATMNIQAGNAGLEQFEVSIRGMVRKKAPKLKATSAKYINPNTGVTEAAYAVVIDAKKLEAALEKIALGLHFHITGARCKFSPTIVNLLTHSRDSSLREQTDSIYNRAIATLGTTPRIGENPAIFSYRHTSFSQPADCSHPPFELILAEFYEAPAFIAVFSADG